MKFMSPWLFLFVISFSSQASVKIIFVPGFKGSELKTLQGNQLVWVSLWQLLNFNTPDLSINQSLYASAVIDKVKLTPFSIGFPVYENWLKSFKKWPLTSEFPYDWRQDNLQTLQRLQTYVTLSAFDNSEICLVGHSMGGLLSLALSYDPTVKVSKIVLVGSPIRGGVGFLKDLQVGETNGLNSKILSPEILANYPSVYSFFSLQGSGLYNENKDPIEMDFYSQSQWESKNIGIFSKRQLSKQEKDAFQQNLNLAKSFRQLFSRNQKPPNTQVLIVRGKGQSTLIGVQKQKQVWDFESGQKSLGDLRVATGDAVPFFDDYTIVETDFEHSKLLDDKKVQDQIQNFCLKKVQ